MLREYRVVNALQETDVRVPKTVTVSEDHSILGSDFYVMEGDVISAREPDRFSPLEYRHGIGDELINHLVELHTVDYEAVDLRDFGHPDRFTERQVKRWTEQFEWAFEVTLEERELSHLQDVTAWLRENVPNEHPRTLIHGDYKLDNVMFAPGIPLEISGIFDWELSTLGDPFTDLGWMLSFWWDAKDPAAPESTGDLLPTFMTRDGYASRQELVVLYEEATGWTFDDERFYRVLTVYKLAALDEMFFRRYLEGNSDDPLYPEMEQGVPELTARAIRIINGEEPL